MTVKEMSLPQRCGRLSCMNQLIDILRRFRTRAAQQRHPGVSLVTDDTTRPLGELIRRRAASDPAFAAAFQLEDVDAIAPPATMREALRLIWQAAKYPILGNGDYEVAVALDAAALERAATAVEEPGDAPEFALWIEALRDPELPEYQRDDIISAIYDVFDPDRD